jgi:hypothetical protein
MKFTTLHSRNRQKGMALVLAIGFLLILSILGAVVMQVSRNDLKNSTAFLPKRQAFYVADRAVEYSMNRDMIYALTAAAPTADLASGSHKTIMLRDDNAIGGDLLEGQVTLIPSENLAMPDQLAELHGNDFGVVLYHVNVKSKAGLGATSNIDASIVRLFKKDDDQIFRTSGGG